MTQGVDYAGGRPGGAAVKAAGFDFAVRYLSDGGPGLPGKLLLPSEADDLRANGVEIVSNWETTADRVLAGYNAGAYDAQQALNQVLACGGSKDRPIYFSCDFDAYESQQAAIDDYLRGAASVLGVENVGIYGGYWPTSRALDNGTAKWVWQTDAWSGANVEHRANLHQQIPTTNINGVSCDINQALTADYGQWSGATGGFDMAGVDADRLNQAVDRILGVVLSRDTEDPRIDASARPNGAAGVADALDVRALADGIAALSTKLDGLPAAIAAAIGGK